MIPVGWWMVMGVVCSAVIFYAVLVRKAGNDEWSKAESEAQDAARDAAREWEGCDV